MTNEIIHIKAGRRKVVVHVNQHHVRANSKDDGSRAVFTVKDGKTNRYAHEVEINGPCKVVYRPHKPLSCGARVWIETRADMTLHLSTP